ncbi:MAG: ATP-binding protein [Pseudomonadota bacterium]
MLEKLIDISQIIESVFELVLVVDENEKIIHASPLLINESKIHADKIINKSLDYVLTDNSYLLFKSAIKNFSPRIRPKVLFSVKDFQRKQVPMQTSKVSLKSGETYFLFHGMIASDLKVIRERDQKERIKELSCIYAVAEWIKISTSIEEFFTKLPTFLSRGMMYPEHAIVYSTYKDMVFGQDPGEHYIKSELIVNDKTVGEIRVGYIDSRSGFLNEEQKMIDEIARYLNTALERKIFSQELKMKEDELNEFEAKMLSIQKKIHKKSSALEDEKKKLKTINSYFDKIIGEWEDTTAHLDTIFKAIPDSVAIIDSDRNIIMTNRKDAKPGDKCYKTFFGPGTICPNCRLSQVLNTKTPIRLNIEIDDKFYEVQSLPILNDKNEVQGILEFYRDITNEKNMEKQLRQADKLTSLGQLISGIGHEINNPNQFIRGNVKILKQSLLDLLPIVDSHYKSNPDLKIARLKYDFFRENILTLVDDMQTGSERIKSIVEGLKRFARKDEGELIDQVDVNNIIHESSRLTHNQVHKYADITLCLDPSLPTFTGNSQKIEQVLINLIINASHAMVEGRRGKIELVSRYEADNLIIEVKDNGKGMTPKTMEMIFDPFFTTKRATGGTGLGLSIAYKIIEEHKGKIEVSSKIDIGTTFKITIKLPKKEITQ